MGTTLGNFSSTFRLANQSECFQREDNLTEQEYSIYERKRKGKNIATDTTRLQQNEQIVEDFFQAINARRLEDLPKYMAANVVDHIKIIYGEADEPGATFEGLRQQLEAFNPLHFQVKQLIAESDCVVARTTMSVVQSGYHPRMSEPTHRRAVVEGIYLFSIKNGKISEIRAVVDRLELFLPLRWD